MMNINKSEKACLPARQGSILIAVLIIMLMILAISLAITRRTTVGTLMAIDSRKSYSAYQTSDQNTEKILNDIKSLDGDISGRIPENTPIAGYCPDAASCYPSSAQKVSDISAIKQIGTEGASEKAIKADVPIRVKNPIKDLTVRNCGDGLGGCSYNRCDMLANWRIADLGLPINNLELRYSSDSGGSLQFGNWKQVHPFSYDYPDTLYAKIKNNNFEYGHDYYVAAKAKNKDNFALDSLYFLQNGGNFQTSVASDCARGQRLGCSSGPILGSRVASSSYSCCGGAAGSLECYECMDGWRRDNNCCTQTCPAPAACSCSACGSASYTPCHENSCGSYTPEDCDTSGCHECPPPEKKKGA